MATMEKKGVGVGNCCPVDREVHPQASLHRPCLSFPWAVCPSGLMISHLHSAEGKASGQTPPRSWGPHSCELREIHLHLLHCSGRVSTKACLAFTLDFS